VAVHMRPEIVGGECPEAPFPIRLEGDVQKGFGRGSKELGCPTANLPDDALEPITKVAKTGVYFGYAQISRDNQPESPLAKDDCAVFPMVMSLGRNPFYGNKNLTAEVHILHTYPSDFYGYHMRVIVLGYIRPELDYVSREALIEDIQTDINVGRRSLDRPGYRSHVADSFFACT